MEKWPIEVRHRPKPSRVGRHREPDSVLAQPSERLVRGELERAKVDLHEVRLDLREIDRHSRGDEPLGQPPCPLVVLREPVDVVLERIDARRGDDSGLSHRAAEEVLEPARLLHRLDGAGDQRAEWAAEPLRQA